jgi:Predicted oxidoreductases (related to aryl-alcohol dehydrogenases)
MKYDHLGSAGAQVSRICLGTMNFGPTTNKEDSFEILDHAVEYGVNFIDTANVYGVRDGNGHRGLTEEIVGEWLKERGNRDNLVIATKVFGQMGPGVNDQGLSAIHIKNAVEASLKRLGTDRIDLYQMHHIDRSGIPIDEILEAFTTLAAQGKIIYLGSSNFSGWNIAQYRERALMKQYLPIVTEQSLYNLVDRTVELEVIPAAMHYGMGLLPWSPLASGVLGGVLRKADADRSKGDRRLDKNRSAIEKYEAFADEHGIAPALLGLAWLLHRPGVTAPIVGPRTLAQLEGAIEAVDIELDPAQMEQLDKIWPGPGNQAPEAYAW